MGSRKQFKRDTWALATWATEGKRARFLVSRSLTLTHNTDSQRLPLRVARQALFDDFPRARAFQRKAY